MRFYKKPFFYFILFFFLPNYLVMSQVCKDSVSYMLASGVSASTADNSPFWLVTDRYGIITAEKYNTWFRAALTGQIALKNVINFSYGIDILERYSNHNFFLLQQAYIGINLGFLTFKGGKWEEIFGNQDQTLAVGGCYGQVMHDLYRKSVSLFRVYAPILLQKVC